MKNISALLEEQVMKRMTVDNPWWVTGKVPDYFTDMPRRAYFDAFFDEVSDIGLRRAVILMGPRRVGKTVMVFHTIARLLEQGVAPDRIVYVSVDTPIYNYISLEDLFSFARRAQKRQGEADGYYVFFDEIQYLKNWEMHLKSLVDTYKGVKFVGSGSASAALKMKSNESGAGRFTDFTLPPLTFVEFLRFRGLDSLVVRTGGDGYPLTAIDIDCLNSNFVDYINYGGYPEVVFSERIRQNPGQYIKSDIIDKVLLRDLPSLYGIPDIQELNMLFVHIAFRTGNEFSYETLSKESGIKKETIRKYLEYLEAAFLIKVVHKIDQTARRMQKVMSFKIYLTNPSLRCALFSPISGSDDMMGAMVETAVFSQWIQGGRSDFYYANWAMGRDRGEVDLVWVDAGTQQPVSVAEIKWTDRFVEKPSELKSLFRFVDEHPGLQRVIVTSLTREETLALHDGRKIMFVPSALYAYGIVDGLFGGERMSKQARKKCLF